MIGIKSLMIVMVALLLGLSSPTQASTLDGSTYRLDGSSPVTVKSPSAWVEYWPILGVSLTIQPDIAGVSHWTWREMVNPKPVTGKAAQDVPVEVQPLSVASEPQKEAEPVQGGAQAIPWERADVIFPRGATAKITHIETGITFEVWRRGGWAHADVEPVSASDTEAMKKAYGEWSWARSPIVVEIGGYRMAASMNGMPHGRQSITNNRFPGHFCIHFLGSTTHGSSYTASGRPKADSLHQKAVQEAIGH